MKLLVGAADAADWLIDRVGGFTAWLTLVMVLLNSHGKLSPLGDANRIKRWLEGNPAARSSKSARRA